MLIRKVKKKLFSRFITVMIIPHTRAKAYNFRIPMVVIYIIILLVVSLPLFFSFYDQGQKNRIRLMAKEMTNLKGKVETLKKLDLQLRIITDLKPTPTDIELSGLGGPEVGSEEKKVMDILGFKQDSSVTGLEQEIEALKKETQIREQSLKELKDFLEEQRSMWAATPSIWPVRGWVTSEFGRRLSPFTGEQIMHEGLDIANRLGTPIRATADGIVTFAGWKDVGMGKMVIINHGYGYITRYGHLSKINVKVGQRVKRREIIGHLGNSGRTTGPHLHYEVIVSGVPANPRNYILN